MATSESLESIHSSHSRWELSLGAFAPATSNGSRYSEFIEVNTPRIGISAVAGDDDYDTEALIGVDGSYFSVNVPSAEYNSKGGSIQARLEYRWYLFRDSNKDRGGLFLSGTAGLGYALTDDMRSWLTTVYGFKLGGSHNSFIFGVFFGFSGTATSPLDDKHPASRPQDYYAIGNEVGGIDLGFQF